MARPRGIPAHNKQSVELIKARLFETHNNIVTLDESTYKNTHEKCKFIDVEFGEWWAYPINVINKGTRHPKKAELAGINRINSLSAKVKRKNTILQKYGVDHLSKNKEIRKKQTKSLNHSYSLTHWKTLEELFCQGSWELKVLEWLNVNKIDFDWQIPFVMPDGRVYFVDLFLKEENKYVEIKGRFFDDGLAKWTWFYKEFPNSELWDRSTLRRKGIKVK